MNDRFTNMMDPQGFASDSFTEAMWETMIVLATTAAICLGVLSLATHLQDTRTVRAAAEANMLLLRDGSSAVPPAGLARIDGREGTRIN